MLLALNGEIPLNPNTFKQFHTFPGATLVMRNKPHGVSSGSWLYVHRPVAGLPQETQESGFLALILPTASTFRSVARTFNFVQ